MEVDYPPAPTQETLVPISIHPSPLPAPPHISTPTGPRLLREAIHAPQPGPIFFATIYSPDVSPHSPAHLQQELLEAYGQRAQGEREIVELRKKLEAVQEQRDGLQRHGMEEHVHLQTVVEMGKDKGKE